MICQRIDGTRRTVLVYGLTSDECDRLAKGQYASGKMPDGTIVRVWARTRSVIENVLGNYMILAGNARICHVLTWEQFRDMTTKRIAVVQVDAEVTHAIHSLDLVPAAVAKSHAEFLQGPKVTSN